MRLLALSPLFALLLAPSGAPQEGPAPLRQITAIKCGRVYTVSHGVLDRAVILVEGGTIVDVIPGDRVPEGAKVVDASDQVVVPGLVDAGTWYADLGSANESFAPQVKAVDGFDGFDSNRSIVSGGVTTAYLAPGTRRLVGGRGCVVKLSGRDRILRETWGLHVIVGDSVKHPPPIYRPPILPSSDSPLLPARRQYPTSRMGEFAELRRFFDEAKRRGGKPDRKAGWPREVLEALEPVLAGREPLVVSASTADDIVKVVLLAAGLGLRVEIVDAIEAHKVADFLAERKVPVSLQYDFFPRGGYRVDEHRPVAEAKPDLRSAAALAKAGVPLALHARGFGDSTDLLFVAGAAVRWGLSEEAALRAVTLAPAEFLGVADRVGSIEKGKHADLVFLSAGPFHAASAVRRVMVDGGFVYERKAGDDRTYDAARADTDRSKKREVLAVRAGRILSVTQGVIVDGLILVENGKITYVGRGQVVPKNAKVLDASKDVVVPGMIDINSHLGFHLDQSETQIARGWGWGEATPQQIAVPASRLVRLDDPAFRDASAQGVTSILLTPRASGACSVIKLNGAGDAVVREVGAFKFQVGSGMAAAEQLRQFLNRAKKYHEEWEAYEKALKEKKEPPKVETTGDKKPDPITGSWSGTMEIPDYNMKSEFTASLKLEGTRVTGTITTSMGGSSDTETIEGTFIGNELKVTGEKEGAHYEITMKLVDANHLKGNWKVSMQGMELKGPIECRRIAGGEGQPPVADSKSQDKKEPKRDETLDPLRPLFRKEIPALLETRDYPSIETALKVFRDEFNLDFVLLGAADAVRMGDHLFQKLASAAFGSDFLVQKRGATVNLAEALASSGVPVAFYSDAASGTKLLPFTAAYAVRYGLDPFDALKAVTLTPARMLGLDGRIGSIERGRDADFVVLSGEPFDLDTRVKKVVVNGKIVHE